MGSIPQVSILKGLGGSGVAGQTRLNRLFEVTAAKPDYRQKTALIYPVNDAEVRKWTIQELDSVANQLARVILRKTSEASPNSDGDCPIAVALPPSDSLIVCLLAIWKAGGAYLPLDLSAPPERLKHILNESKPLLVISQDSSLDIYKTVNCVSYAELKQEADQVSSTLIQSKDALPSGEKKVAIILYTSGSTGIPKGVRVLHSAILNRLKWQWREFPYSQTEKVSAFKTSLTFVDSVSEIWGPLLYSDPRSVLIIPKCVTTNPERLILLLDQYKIERLVLVPTLLRTMLMHLNLSENKDQLQDLKLWVCSGETLVPSLASEFIRYFNTGSHTLSNFYGSTEIMGDVSFHVIRHEKDVNYEGKVPIGIPVDNTILYLLDKDLKTVPMGEVGELYVAGKNLAEGYVNGRDAFRFIDNPHTVDPEYDKLFRTGDFGRIVKGSLIFEGRTDSQVKVRGNRVDLSEIDSALSKLQGIQKFITLCYKPGEVEQAVLSFVLLQDDASTTDREIENELKAHLQPYAVPQVVVVPKIPLLVNGKIDRQFLLNSYESLINQNVGDFSIDYSGVPLEQIDAAQALFQTVGSVLGASVKGKVSATSNFYALGGNSLNSVFTVTKLRDQGYNISITDFISAKTLLDVVRKISNDKGKTVRFPPRFNIEMLKNAHRKDLTRIIVDSFYEKADLERWIEPPIQRQDYYDLVDVLWDPLVQKGLSFVVKSESGDIIGACLNFDAHDEPEVTITSGLKIVFDFLEYLEGPIRDTKLPQGKGKILHSFMMGTEKTLSSAENVEVIQVMEEEVIGLARSRHFTGIFTSNTNPLTQQLGTDVFNYTVLHDYQPNQYVASDGTRPFKRAPNDQRVLCSWKVI